MPEDNADKIWDEYDWERFLQQQEQRTEKYMELLDKYMDDPRRDEIIAREMGWPHLLDDNAQDWEDELDAQFEQDIAEFAGTAEPAESVGFGFQRHPLYQQTLAFTSELDEIFDRTPERTQEHPATITLHSQITLAAAKLAAALNDDGSDELGMTIAYLKRALHAVNMAHEALVQLADGRLLDTENFARVHRRLFSVRDGIVTEMGACRAEFRKRSGR